MAHGWWILLQQTNHETISSLRQSPGLKKWKWKKISKLCMRSSFKLIRLDYYEILKTCAWLFLENDENVCAVVNFPSSIGVKKQRQCFELTLNLNLKSSHVIVIFYLFKNSSALVLSSRFFFVCKYLTFYIPAKLLCFCLLKERTFSFEIKYNWKQLLAELIH